MEEGNADREAHGYKPYTSQGRLPGIQNQSTDLGELPRAYRKQGFFRRLRGASVSRMKIWRRSLTIRNSTEDTIRCERKPLQKQHEYAKNLSFA